MENSGWIKVYRTIFDEPLPPDHFYLWTYLIACANYRDRKIIVGQKEIMVKRGQILTGRKILSVKTGLSESKIERLLGFLEKLQQIKQQKTTKFRIISIVNYEKYQQADNVADNVADNERTMSGQHCEPFCGQQADNERTQTRKIRKIRKKEEKKKEERSDQPDISIIDKPIEQVVQYTDPLSFSGSGNIQYVDEQDDQEVNHHLPNIINKDSEVMTNKQNIETTVDQNNKPPLPPFAHDAEQQSDTEQQRYDGAAALIERARVKAERAAKKSGAWSQKKKQIKSLQKQVDRVKPQLGGKVVEPEFAETKQTQEVLSYLDSKKGTSWGNSKLAHSAVGAVLENKIATTDDLKILIDYQQTCDWMLEYGITNPERLFRLEKVEKYVNEAKSAKKSTKMVDNRTTEEITERTRISIQVNKPAGKVLPKFLTDNAYVEVATNFKNHELIPEAGKLLGEHNVITVKKRFAPNDYRTCIMFLPFKNLYNVEWPGDLEEFVEFLKKQKTLENNLLQEVYPGITKEELCQAVEQCVAYVEHKLLPKVRTEGW